MGIRLRVGEAQGFTPLDPARWYVARLVRVAEDEVPFQGRPQAKYRFDFVVLDPPEFAGREIDGLVNQPTGGELNERHTLYDWITVLRGGVPLNIGDEIDFPEQFLGKIVLVQIESKTKQYDAGKQPFTFQNVKKLGICADAHAYEHLYPLVDVQAAAAASAVSPNPAPAPQPSPSPTPATQGAQPAQPATPAQGATPQPQPVASGAGAPSPTTPAASPQPAQPATTRPAPVEPPQPAQPQPAPQPAPQQPAPQPGGATVQVNGTKKKVPF